MSAGFVLLWLAAVAWLLVGARSEMAAGTSDLRAVRRDASISSLVEPASRADIRAAADHFDAAEAKIDSPLLAPLQIVPVASRHLRASRQVVDASQEGAAVADDALGSLVELTERPRTAGPERVETLHDLAEIAGRAQVALDGIDPGSPDALIGPLGDAVAELDEQRADAARAAGRLRSTSLAVADVLQGPTPYLLLGANNAEMRNGSGMALSAAELSFDEGRMQLGDVRPTADLVVGEGEVPASGDLAANWPWIDAGRDLRNVGLTADFPQSASLAVDTWSAVPGGGEVGGVILIDVDGIRSLLRVVGPVEVDGVRYTADTVRGELLRRQYSRFDGDRASRRDQLGAVARAIFERLEAGAWRLEDLATQLADAVQGRHLLVWSTDAEAAKAWDAVGADGHLSEDSVSVGLLNRGATKTDSWVDAAVDVVTTSRIDDRHDLTLTYTIDNRVPGSGPAYVVGPNVDGLAAGDHAGLAMVSLPAGSTDVEMTGAEVFLQGGDGPTVVVGGRVVVPRGETATVTVTAVLPAGLDHLVLEPSARIDPTAWTVNGVERERDRRRTLAIDGS
ncbi:DUF4012 domain-containing protein [Aquihabitans daechungensis]|uniref:DUF4012 domain-containing protein n=1 Tax=Aquihabitans daechungensis TaxID=1052257 RepID=UPI003B9F766F